MQTSNYINAIWLLLIIHIFSVKKIQKTDITEADIVLLNSEYRSEFRKLKNCIDEFEKISKDEDEDGELSEDVNLFRNQLKSLQSAFRY